MHTENARRIAVRQAHRPERSRGNTSTSLSINPELSRRIDYWLGIPLCFFFSILNYIQKALSFKRQTTRPIEKIAFIKLPELGAIILAYPLISAIKQEYPRAELFFVTFDKNKGIFPLLNAIIPEKNILGIRESPLAFVLDTLKAIGRLRRERVDVIIDLEFFSRYSAIFSYLSQAQKRIGFYCYTFEGLYRGNFLTHKIQYNPLNHVSRSYLSMAQTVEEKEKNTPQLPNDIADDLLIFPRYSSQEATRKSLISKLNNLGIGSQDNKLFLINPGEGVLPLREWPIENFIALSKLILEDNKNYILLIGTLGASNKAARIQSAINQPRCVSLVNQTKLGELLELFSIADSLISNDCGLAHLAMLAPIKKFIIFGPESPQVFSALGENIRILYSRYPCSPCLSVFNHRQSKCADNLCLKAIKPQDVFNLIKAS